MGTLLNQLLYFVRDGEHGVAETEHRIERQPREIISVGLRCRQAARIQRLVGNREST